MSQSDRVPVSWFVASIAAVGLFWLGVVGLAPRAVRWAVSGWRR